MLLCDKYKPMTTQHIDFNLTTLNQLMYISTYDNIPHIIISGPVGCGKKTMLNFFLESLYNKNVHKLTRVKYDISGSSAKKSIEILQSDYHIIIQATKTNHDKYVLQEIIKKYSRHKPFDILKDSRPFKTVVIYNVEDLAANSQSALRRTMEIYASNCRFIMLCSNLSKIFDPLRSRCTIFRLNAPTNNVISKIIDRVIGLELLQITDSQKQQVLTKCDGSIKEAMWLLEEYRAIGANVSIDRDNKLQQLGMMIEPAKFKSIQPTKCSTYLSICYIITEVVDLLTDSFTISADTIMQLVTKIIKKKKIPISQSRLDKIVNDSGDNLKKCIESLNTFIQSRARNKTNFKITISMVNEAMDELLVEKKINRKFDTTLLCNSDVLNIFKKIRSKIYDVLIDNIKGSDIIISILDGLVKRISALYNNTISDQIIFEIISYASEAEYNLVHGRREILAIDYFICGVMNVLYKHN